MKTARMFHRLGQVGGSVYVDLVYIMVTLVCFYFVIYYLIAYLAQSKKSKFIP